MHVHVLVYAERSSLVSEITIIVLSAQIAVEGNIASGKSTLLSKLSQLESVEVRNVNTVLFCCHALVNTPH